MIGLYNWLWHHVHDLELLVGLQSALGVRIREVCMEVERNYGAYAFSAEERIKFTSLLCDVWGFEVDLLNRFPWEAEDISEWGWGFDEGLRRLCKGRWDELNVNLDYLDADVKLPSGVKAHELLVRWTLNDHLDARKQFRDWLESARGKAWLDNVCSKRVSGDAAAKTKADTRSYTDFMVGAEKCQDSKQPITFCASSAMAYQMGRAVPFEILSFYEFLWQQVTELEWSCNLHSSLCVRIHDACMEIEKDYDTYVFADPERLKFASLLCDVWNIEDELLNRFPWGAKVITNSGESFDIDLEISRRRLWEERDVDIASPLKAKIKLPGLMPSELLSQWTLVDRLNARQTYRRWLDTAQGKAWLRKVCMPRLNGKGVVAVSVETHSYTDFLTVATTGEAATMAGGDFAMPPMPY